MQSLQPGWNPILTSVSPIQDRYAGLSGAGSFRGGGFRGGLRGLRGSGGLRGGGFRGGFRGGFAGGAAAEGRAFNQDLYADYSGPDQQSGSGLRMDSYPTGPAFGGGGGFAAAGGSAPSGYEPEPSQQIMVRNVSTLLFCNPSRCFHVHLHL